jgi:adenosyl cobinamide kinase/adenosyl cobinamide phosphate guanylyltransferase
MECLNEDAKKQRHNEISRLCERRKYAWKKVSKIFLEILLEDKSYKVYKTDEEKKKVMLNCVKNWVDNNREKHNSNTLKFNNKKNRWNSISENFRKILL